MYSQIYSDLTQRGQLALDGAFDAIVGQYLYPMPVFLQGRRTIVTSGVELVPALALLRDALRQRRVIRLEPRVNALELPRAGRFRVWVRWREITASPADTGLSDVIYYCRTVDGAVKTEMMDYTRLSMPELRDSFVAVSMSA